MKTQKTLLALFLAFLIVVTPLFSCSAGSAPTISVDSVTCEKGTTYIDLPIRMSDNPGIISLMISVQYDANILTLESVTDSGLLDDIAQSEKITDNPYIISWAASLAAENITDDGILATLRFKVADSATGSTTVQLSYSKGSTVNKDLRSVDFVTQDGTVTIIDPVRPSITASPASLTINVGGSASSTVTTVPAGQSITVRSVSVSHTQYTKSGSEVTFVGKSAGTDSYDFVMTYNGTEYKTRVTVKVVDPVPTPVSITVKSEPTKKTYYVGDTLDTSGMVIEAVYSDGSAAVVEGWQCTPTTFTKAGAQTVTVSYTEKGVSLTASFTVTVKTPTINLSATDIELVVKQSRTITCTTEPSGQTFNVRANSASHTQYTKSGSRVTFTAKSVGVDTYDLYMMYNGKEYSQTVTVTVTDSEDQTLVSIEITEEPAKTDYFIGDELDTAGMVVTALYANGGSAVVRGWTCTPTSFTEAGVRNITVSYTEGGVTSTAFFVVSVQKPEVFVFPNPVELAVDDSVRLDWVAEPAQSVTWTQDAGSERLFRIKVENDDVTLIGKSGGTANLYATLTYKGVEYKSTIPVKVLGPVMELTGISVTTMPNKTTYLTDETLNTEGMVVTASYSDGSSKAVSGWRCSPMTFTAEGKQTITVTYTEYGVTKTTSFTVSVVRPRIVIRNAQDGREVAYRSTIEFAAIVTNPVADAQIRWYINGREAGVGETYRAVEVKSSFTVQVKYVKNSTVLAESAVQNIHVRTGFFAKLAAFFRALFGKLPVIVQEYLGAEWIDRILP